MYAFPFPPLFFLLIIFLNFFSLLFSIMPNFSVDILVWSWLVSFPHLLHSSFSYLKYLTDFDEAVATQNTLTIQKLASQGANWYLCSSWMC